MSAMPARESVHALYPLPDIPPLPAPKTQACNGPPWPATARYGLAWPAPRPTASPQARPASAPPARPARLASHALPVCPRPARLPAKARHHHGRFAAAPLCSTARPCDYTGAAN